MEREEAEWVVQRHGQTVYRLAYARTGNREDAEDVTQETFLRLVRAAPKFRDEDHCRAWLLRVAANCAQDLFRALGGSGSGP
ncbi:RNA polymerase sigma factor [Muriventricola aceti]|uniref:RNA polymerase sigma factor n=1 Tax=Muriventricola aceti TaxID=2981773 RepID=UPI003EC0B816